MNSEDIKISFRHTQSSSLFVVIVLKCHFLPKKGCFVSESQMVLLCLVFESHHMYHPAENENCMSCLSLPAQLLTHTEFCFIIFSVYKLPFSVHKCHLSDLAMDAATSSEYFLSLKILNL